MNKQEKHRKIKEWKRQWYPNYSAHDLGGTKAMATWFKEKGLDILRIHLSHKFHLDMFCNEMIADRFIRIYKL